MGLIITVSIVNEDETKTEYQLQFASGIVQKNYTLGKAFVMMTQCVVLKDYFVIGFANVVRHKNDQLDMNVAYKAATKKIFSQTEVSNKIPKNIRKIFWDKIRIPNIGGIKNIEIIFDNKNFTTHLHLK